MSAALLISGGQDSAALAFWQRPTLGIFVNYGQVPVKAEQRAARIICEEIQIPLEVIEADCSQMGSGQLAGRSQMHAAPTPEWWPFRNQLLLTLAGAVAVRNRMSELLIGTVATDVRHRDGTQEFIRLMDRLLSIQEGQLRVRAPAIDLSSAELILNSGIPDEVLAWTHSCFVADIPCLDCGGCIKHLSVLDQLGRR